MFLALGDELATLELDDTSEAPAPAPAPAPASGASATPWEMYEPVDDAPMDFVWPTGGVHEREHIAGDSPAKKKPSIGSVEDRWAVRLLKTTIMNDLGNGCGCGCVSKLSYDDVLTCRTARKNEDGLAGNRSFIRGYLLNNENSSKKYRRLACP